MKNVLLADVVFNPGSSEAAGTLDFSSVEGFDSRALLGVLHGPFNKLIYGKTIDGKGGTFDGALLTLELDVHLLASDAPLTIMYDSTVFQIGNWPTDYPDSAAAVLLDKILAKFGQAGLTWDGASTPGLEPVLSNSGRTVTWSFDESFIYGATKSTFAISRGAYFTATRVNLTGDYNVSAILGYATAAFNPADFGSLSGTSIAVSSGTMSANNSAIGADYSVLNAHTLADGDLIVTYVNRSGNAWHAVVPVGQAYDDLQAMVGLGSEIPLGIVAGTLFPFIGFEGAALTGTALMSLTSLTDAELADIEFTPKPGYANAVESKALAVDLEGVLAALQAPLPLPQNAAKENGGNLTAIAAGVKQALAAMAGGAGITWTSLDVATNATASFTPRVASFVPREGGTSSSWIHASRVVPDMFRARIRYDGFVYTDGFLTFGVIDPSHISFGGVTGEDAYTGTWNGAYSGFQGIHAVGVNSPVHGPGSPYLMTATPMPDGGEWVIWGSRTLGKMAIMTADGTVHDNLQFNVGGLVPTATTLFCGYLTNSGPGNFSIITLPGLPPGIDDPDWFVGGVDAFAAPGLPVDDPNTQTLLLSLANKLDTLIAASSTTNSVLASINTAVGTVKTAVDSVTGAVEDAITALDAGNVNTGNIATYASPISAALNTLQGLASTGNTALGTLHADGLNLQTLVSTGNAALATLHIDVTAGTTAVVSAVNAVATAVAAVNSTLGTGNGSLATLVSQTSSLSGALAALQTLIGTTNTDLGTLHVDLGAINTLITTGNATLVNIQGYVASGATAANQVTAQTSLTAMQTALADIQTSAAAGATAAGQSSALSALNTLHADLTSTCTKLDTIASDMVALGGGKTLANVVTALNPLATDVDLNAMSTALQALENSELAKLSSIDSKLGGTLGVNLSQVGGSPYALGSHASSGAAPVVQASDYGISSTSGTITSTAGVVSLAVPAGANSVIFEITGTFSGSFYFETVDSVQTSPLICSYIPGNIGVAIRTDLPPSAATGTTNTRWVSQIPAGTTTVQLAGVGWASGTLSVSIFTSPTNVSTMSMLQNGTARAMMGVAAATLLPLTTATLTAGSSYTGTALDCYNVASGVAGSASYAKEYRAVALSDVACSLFLNDSSNNSTFYPWQAIIGATVTTNLSTMYRAEYGGAPKQRFVQPVIKNTSGSSNTVCVLTHAGIAA